MKCYSSYSTIQSEFVILIGKRLSVLKRPIYQDELLIFPQSLMLGKHVVTMENKTSF